jgi:hypothetical protein
MNHVFKLVAAVAVLSAVPAASAMARSVAGGIDIGTPGIGLEAEVQITPMLVLRGAVDGISISHKEDYSGVSYDGKAKLLTGGVFADLHPGGSSLLVSGGAYFGKRRLDLRATPSSNTTIGGVSYTPAQIGTITGAAKLSKAQPFVGIGYDNTFVGEHAWGFRALLGVSFSKRPKVNLSTSGGLLSSDPTFQARLRQQELDTEHDARNFRYYPVVQVGVTHRF